MSELKVSALSLALQHHGTHAGADAAGIVATATTFHNFLADNGAEVEPKTRRTRTTSASPEQPVTPTTAATVAAPAAAAAAAAPAPTAAVAAPAASAPASAASAALGGGPTLQKVADSIIDLANTVSREAAVSVLTKYGAQKVPQIKPADFSAVLADVAILKSGQPLPAAQGAGAGLM